MTDDGRGTEADGARDGDGRTGRDWLAWHEPYDEPGSFLARRLTAVQARVRDALDDAPPGPFRAVSICAGQGRDLLGVLATHPRAGDVTGRLVELDPRNTDAARAALAPIGNARLEVVTGDASSTAAYGGAVPADLVLVCGVFGNVRDDDVKRTVRMLPSLCAPGATVVWTRHRLDPDLTPTIRAWFAGAGFDEVGFDSPGAAQFAVGTNRFAGQPAPLPEPPQPLFTFVGFDTLLGR